MQVILHAKTNLTFLATLHIYLVATENDCLFPHDMSD